MAAACGSTATAPGDVAAGGDPGPEQSETVLPDGASETTVPGSAGPEAAGPEPAGPEAAEPDAAGSSSAGDSGSASPESSGGPVDTGPNVTSESPSPVNSPIKVGVLDWNTKSGASAQVGADDNRQTSTSETFDALIRYLNKHGGLAGRQIEMIEYTIDTNASNYEQGFSAACALFTQDNHVAIAVTAALGLYSANYESCLNQAGVPSIESDFSTSDSVDQEAYPLRFNLNAPNLNRSVTAMLDKSREMGWLTTDDRLGVIVEGCPYNVRVYEDTLVPWANRHGIPQQRQDMNCFTGFGQVGGNASQIQNAALRFRADGVTKIMFISNWEQSFLFLFSTYVQSQRWRPGYVFSSHANLGANQSQYDPEQLVNMRGVGWAPVADLTNKPEPNEAQAECLSMLQSEGIAAPAPGSDDLRFMYSTCEPFHLLQAALALTNGDSSATALRSAIESLDSSWTGLSNLGSAFSATRHDAPSRVSWVEYRTGCSCFQYVGSPSSW